MKIMFRSLAALCCVLAGWQATAHHSYSMFDSGKEIRLVGTVKEFQWTNPHVWVQVLVEDKDGKVTEWSVEGAGLNTLIRQGWTRKTVKVGEKVTVTIHPMRNGQNGGSLIRLYMPDGRVLGEPLPAASP
jgi:hypothetical protein